jgi:hypothetical protein
MSWIKDKIKNWLEIEHAQDHTITIIEPYNYDMDVLKNELWYRGDESELEQFYQQIDDGNSNTKFWPSSSTTGVEFRKIHSGLPKIMIDILSDVVVGSLDKVRIDNEEETSQALWEDIAEDNNFDEMLNEAIKVVAVKGDGAFKISMDSEVSKYPIIEFYPAERVKYEYKRGRLDAVIFLTRYTEDKKSYILEERYDKTGITNKLYDKDGNEVPIGTVPELAGLTDVTNPEYFQKIMAVPLMFKKSLKWKGRGESLLEGKSGAFDALDEIVSQWMDALRDGRSTKYIPETLLPHNPQTGQPLKPNSFDNRYVKIGGNLTEDNTDKIDVVSADIKAQQLEMTYITFLDLSMQGIVSPSTLGIDVKKLDNAEAQREKEKTTLYTRGKLIHALEKTLPQLIERVLNVYEIASSESFSEHEVSVSFGNYANPSFEALVETLSKARPGQNIISIEQCVEEMYGDSWTDDEKADEVKRLKDELGILEMEQVDIVDDVEGTDGQDGQDNGS